MVIFPSLQANTVHSHVNGLVSRISMVKSASKNINVVKNAVPLESQNIFRSAERLLASTVNGSECHRIGSVCLCLLNQLAL